MADPIINLLSALLASAIIAVWLNLRRQFAQHRALLDVGACVMLAGLFFGVLILRPSVECFLPDSIPIADTKPRRVIDAFHQQRLAKFLRCEGPKSGHAKFTIYDEKYQLLTETLVSILETQGWTTDFPNNPQGIYPMMYFEGVHVRGVDAQFTDKLIKALKIAGLTDAKADQARDGTPTSENSVQIVIGHIRDR